MWESAVALAPLPVANTTNKKDPGAHGRPVLSPARRAALRPNSRPPDKNPSPPRKAREMLVLGGQQLPGLQLPLESPSVLDPLSILGLPDRELQRCAGPAAPRAVSMLRRSRH